MNKIMLFTVIFFLSLCSFANEPESRAYKSADEGLEIRHTGADAGVVPPRAGDFSLDAFLKSDSNIANSIKKQNVAIELSFVPLEQLEADRQRAGNLIEIEDYKFFSTLVFDDNWDIYFAIWPKDSSMDEKTVWSETELEKGAVYEYRGIKFNIALKNRIISMRYVKKGKRFISRISYNDIFDRLYAKSKKIIFSNMVKYAIVRNHEPLKDKAGIIALRLDRYGKFWYSFNLDDKISNQIKWLVGVNGVLYGIKVRDNNLVFFSKVVNIDKRTHGKEKLLNY